MPLDKREIDDLADCSLEIIRRQPFDMTDKEKAEIVHWSQPSPSFVGRVIEEREKRKQGAF